MRVAPDRYGAGTSRGFALRAEAKLERAFAQGVSMREFDLYVGSELPVYMPRAHVTRGLNFQFSLRRSKSGAASNNAKAFEYRARQVHSDQS